MRDVPGFITPLDENHVGEQWPGGYPGEFVRSCGWELGMSDSAFRSSLFEEVERHLGSTAEGEQDLREWFDTGLRSDEH